MGTQHVKPPRLEEQVKRYLVERGREVWPDEIAEELKVSLLDVLTALKSLGAKGEAEEVRRVEREV